MTLEALYQQFQGNYEDVLSRLLTEERVSKFIQLYLQDENAMQLKKAMDEEQYELAFRAAHTIKGVCQNLGITSLFEKSHEITEALRGQHDISLAHQLLPGVIACHEKVVEAIHSYEEQNHL